MPTKKVTYLLKCCFIVFAWVSLVGIGYSDSSNSPTTPLERCGYRQLTSSHEISSFLARLSGRYDLAEKITIAVSALGNPVDALLVSSNIDRFKDAGMDSNQLTVMLVGSQHGTEPSGAEALLLAARDMVGGNLTAYLRYMNFIVIPNSNPDGRDLKRRTNNNGVNLSTNFVVLTEPECRGLIDALHRWRPDVILDIHESAVLKKKSLAKQGYLTDFEAQFEAANNPNVDEGIRAFSFARLLPDIIQRVNAQGLPAQRYIGEITSIHQTITHGGLSLRNLRNMAGMLHSFSFLVENRLDPSTGTYPTPGNIRARVAKQYLCIVSFLESWRNHRSEIMALSQTARMRWKNPRDKKPLFLNTRYAADPTRPQITLPLRKIDTGAVTQHTFNYHGSISAEQAVIPPSAYIITSHQEFFQDYLSRHHIIYSCKNRFERCVRVPYLKRQAKAERIENGEMVYTIEEHQKNYIIDPNDLFITLNQPLQNLILLLFEPQSSISLFHTIEYRHLAEGQNDFFLYKTCEILDGG
jgi:hypothetical protein